MRVINTGKGIARTNLSPAEIAGRRADRIGSLSDQNLYMDTFARVRKVAPSLAHVPLDLEMICVELTRHSATMEAAMIEALASLRAEGVRL